MLSFPSWLLCSVNGNGSCHRRRIHGWHFKSWMFEWDWKDLRYSRLEIANWNFFFPTCRWPTGLRRWTGARYSSLHGLSASSASAAGIARRARRHAHGGCQDPQEDRRQPEPRRVLQVDEAFRDFSQSLNSMSYRALLIFVNKVFLKYKWCLMFNFFPLWNKSIYELLTNGSLFSMCRNQGYMVSC